MVSPRHTSIMGVVNVTPDSFSDGGRWLDPDVAVARGRELAAAGADLIDVGGESTRPGSTRPQEAEERDRVLPVVSALAQQGYAVSIDTMRAGVAQAALEAGAVLVNDVSGGLGDPEMGEMVAQTGARYVVMHWRGLLSDPAATHHYDDVVEDVCAELGERVEALVGQGVREEQLVLDPGFGFSKDAGHNWALLAGLDRVVALGLPVLVGTSRKRFLGRLPVRPGAQVPDEPSPAGLRDAATAATSLLAAQAGAWAVRVHEVAPTRDALAVWELTQGAARAR